MSFFSIFKLVGWSLWSLWEMRNDCVFNNATPNRHELARSILDEAKLWLLAGAKELGRGSFTSPY
jgi:hypothetical protein